MKLQFDPHQQFQIDAVDAIADLFDGQPQSEPTFSIIKVSEADDLFTGHERSELGVGNNLLLSPETLHGNLRMIQRRNWIDVGDPDAAIEAWDVFDQLADRARSCPHFSVEMETGTGKTYVYLRTIFELAKRLRLSRSSLS